MDQFRTPFFVAAAISMLVAVMIEGGGAMPAFASRVQTSGEFESVAAKLADDPFSTGNPDDEEKSKQDRAKFLEQFREPSPPGIGIPSLALFDGFILFTVALLVSPMLVTGAIHGRAQGVVSLIFAISILGMAIAMIGAAIVKLQLMLGLITAPPFGPLVYLGLFGFFATTAAGVILGFSLSLKLTFVVCLVLAQPRFLQNKGLVLLVALSLLLGVLLSFLHGFVPGILVSITDAIGGLIINIVTAIWAIITLIFAIIAIIKAIV